MIPQVRRAIGTIALVTALTTSVARGQEVLTPLDDQVTGIEHLTIAAPGATTLQYALDGRAPSTVPVRAGRAHVQVDFGAVPFSHMLTLVALDATGAPMSTRREIINPGGSAAYLEVIEPTPRTQIDQDARAIVCAHLPRGDKVVRADLVRDGTIAPLLVFDDPRCGHGTGLIASIPAAAAPYLEARVTSTQGRSLTTGILLGKDATVFNDSVTVRELQYLVRPVGRDGMTIPDLAKETFHVAEDRRDLPVRAVRSVRDTPLRVAIVLDASQSTYGDSDLESALVRATLDMLDFSKDKAIVYAIRSAPHPQLTTWSNEEPIVEDALRRVLRLRPSSSTAAFDTLEDVLYQFQSAGEYAGAAGAILYMTDGADSLLNDPVAEARRRAQVVGYARALGVQVYAFDVQMPHALADLTGLRLKENFVHGAYLDALARATGGERVSLRLAANPTPFLREAERLAMRERDAQAAGDTQAQVAAKAAKEANLRVYQAHLTLARADTPGARQIADAIRGIGERLREQYVISFEPTVDGKPRERSLRFAVDDPRVVAVRAPNGAYY